MILEHESLYPFESLIRSIHTTAFTTGQKYLENNKKTIEDLKKDSSLFKPFIKYCHKGYDKAQKIIAKEVISLYEFKEERLKDLRKAKERKKTEEVKNILNIISIVENRILALRRIVDAIVFTLFGYKPWVARRFVLHELIIREVDADAIKAALKEATYLNDKDKLTFSLVTDLSTFIDVGDLIQINFHKSPAEWEIIELKKGRVNKILGDIIDREGENLSEKRLKEIKDEISSHAPKQISRMVKQRVRATCIYDIIKSDIGKDVQYGTPLILSKEETMTPGYGEVVEKATINAREKGFSVHLIDECLFIIAFRGLMSKGIHLLYHFLQPDVECAFIEKMDDEVQNELREMKVISKSHFTVDLTNNNFYTKSSTPFFLYTFDYETMFDLLFDRIRIILHLDIDKLSEVCSSKGFTLNLCSKKETEEKRQALGRKVAPLYNGRMLRIRTPEGYEYTLLGGTFHKVFFDIIRPKELLSIWEREDKEMFERINK